MHSITRTLILASVALVISVNAPCSAETDGPQPAPEAATSQPELEAALRYLQSLNVDTFKSWTITDVRDAEALNFEQVTFKDRGFAALASLPSLTTLNLQYARMTPACLAELWECRALTSLDLYGLRVVSEADLQEERDHHQKTMEAGVWSGPARIFGRRLHDDDLGGISGLTSLVHLNLGNAAIGEALQSISTLSALKTLAIPHTQVSDEHLQHLRAMRQLTTLDLSSCEVSDLRYLSALDQLKALNLSNTAMYPVALHDLGAFHQLEDLDLTGLTIHDKTLAALAGLPVLTRLSMKDTTWTAQGLQNLASSQSLTHLRIHSPPSHIQSIAAIKTLTHLHLSTPGLIGSTELEHLASLGALEQLTISTPDIEDAGLMYLAELKSLRELDLTKTRILRSSATMLQATMPRCKVRTGYFKAQDQ